MLTKRRLDCELTCTRDIIGLIRGALVMHLVMPMRLIFIFHQCNFFTLVDIALKFISYGFGAAVGFK